MNAPTPTIREVHPRERAQGIALKLSPFVEFSMRTVDVIEAGIREDRRARTFLESIPADGGAVKAPRADDWGDLALRTAEGILYYLGRGADASKEPGADRHRDELCRIIEAALSTHTAAGAGPVGEAVAQFRTVGCSDWYDGLPDNEDGGGPYEVRTLYARPVEEPGEVERRIVEIIEPKGDEHGVWCGSPLEAVIAVQNERDELQAALAETRERLEKVKAERDALAKVQSGCRWYWPADDTEASVDSAQDAYEQACGWERYDGTVIAIARGGIVERTWCAALPAADDSDSDDEFWVEEASEEAAQAKINAERQRRVALTDDAQEGGK